MRRGVWKTLHTVLHGKTPLNPYSRLVARSTHPFDIAYGVDTSGFEDGEEFAVNGARVLPSGRGRGALWNTAYYGIAPSVFEAAMELTRVTDWARFTFVDIGCGKGRALLLASRLPFGKILGVELNPALAAIAESNIRSFHATWQRCSAFEVRATDAAELDLPRTPLFLYLYHPFLAPVLRQVLQRLERSVRRLPREVWLVYVNPEAASVMKHFPFLAEACRVSLPVSCEDALPDRFASAQEEVAVFHYLP